jgi:hypothetical protein
MKIQIAMDNHLEGHEEFAAQVRAVAKIALSQFGDHITWVKGSNDDNRCVKKSFDSTLGRLI